LAAELPLPVTHPDLVANRAAAAPLLSVVVPVHNEAGNVAVLLDEIETALGGRVDYEVVFVDDASSDDTALLLVERAQHQPRLRVLRHLRNSGQSTAIVTGVRAARGRLIATLDGDGQNDPADIPALLSAGRDCDMVVGIRATRRDSWLRRMMSRIANEVRGRMLGDNLQDSGCALKVFRAEVLLSFFPIRSLYSFMPAMAVAAGHRIKEQPVNHRDRRTGVSKYGFGTFAWRPLVDMLALWWLLRCRPALRRR